MSRPLRRLILASALAMACFGATGCDDPCAELEQRVCQPKDESLQRAYQDHCKLMQEPERREALPGDACVSILKHIDRLER